jgi:MFS family permease
MTVVTALAGTRWGLTIALAGLTLAATGIGLATGFGTMMAARALAGFFAGGLLPAAIQALSESFPARLRPLAIGLLLAASPLVALLVLPLHSHIVAAGWRAGALFGVVPTAAAAVLCWVALPPPAPSGRSRGVAGMAVASVVMLGVGLFLTAPLYTLVQSWLPVLLRRSMDTVPTTLPAINLGAGAVGAIVAGLAAWALIRTGARPWKTRAALLTVFGVLLPLAAVGGIYAEGGALVVVSALVMALDPAWAVLLYAAVADALPARGVAIGAAVGGFVSVLSSAAAMPLLASGMGAFGTTVAFGAAAAAAGIGVLVAVLLAWLVRPEPAAAPAADAPAAA